jgi:hypothetical protein
VSEADDPAPRRGPPPGRPGDDLLFAAFAVAAMSVFLIFNAMNVYHERARVGRPIAFWEPLSWELTSGLYLMLVLPLLLTFSRRVWLGDRPLAPRLGLHVAVAVAVSLGHVIAMGAMRWAVYRLAHAHYDPLSPLGDWPYELRKDLLGYAAIVGPYVGWRYLRAVPPAAAEGSPDVLEVRDGARRHFVPLAEVVWVEAAGNYVELHRGGAGLLHRASLSAMEQRLQRAGFVRIHRSRLVSRDAVAAVESKATGDFVVRLRDGRELAGSRRYRRPLLAD